MNSRIAKEKLAAKKKSRPKAKSETVSAFITLKWIKSEGIKMSGGRAIARIGLIIITLAPAIAVAEIDGSGLPRAIDGSGTPMLIGGKEIIFAIDGSGIPMAIDGSGTPKAIDGSGIPMAIDGSGKPKAIDGSGIPMAIDGSGTPKAIDGSGIPKAIDGSGIPMAIDGSGNPLSILARGKIEGISERGSNFWINGQGFNVSRTALSQLLAVPREADWIVYGRIHKDGSTEVDVIALLRGMYVPGETTVVATGKILAASPRTGEFLLGKVVVDYSALLAGNPLFEVTDGQIVQVIGIRPNFRGKMLAQYVVN